MSLIDEFKEYITNTQNTRVIPTGFDSLDNIYGGGLPKGLTILGAHTKIGKSTFVLQLADYMAKQENVKVLFYSLELTRYELLTKSLSHISYTNEILDNKSPNDFIKNNIEDIDRYLEIYGTFENNISLIDNNRNIDDILDDIKENVENNPNDKIVVIIDYLQFIQNKNIQGDKQRIDNIVLRLKDLSNKQNLPIILISSLSRNGEFKESGSIEYTADYLLMLSLIEKCNDYNKLELTFLRNRFGEDNKSIKMRYYGKYATFVEN